jgi:hypothetical protein
MGGRSGPAWNNPAKWASRMDRTIGHTDPEKGFQPLRPDARQGREGAVRPGIRNAARGILGSEEDSASRFPRTSGPILPAMFPKWKGPGRSGCGRSRRHLPAGNGNQPGPQTNVSRLTFVFDHRNGWRTSHFSPRKARQYGYKRYIVSIHFKGPADSAPQYSHYFV